MYLRARGRRSAVWAAACAALVALLAVVPAAAAVRKVPGAAFRPAVTGTRYYASLGGLGPLEAAVRFTAPLHLPAGARITGADFFYFSAGVGQITVSLVRLDPSDTPSSPVTIGTGTSGAGPWGLTGLALSPDSSLTLVRKRCSYALVLDFAQTINDLQEVRVRYTAP